jgi:hypothetical protein
VPKTTDASSVNDFTPISLLNCTLKLTTKLLHNKLQTITQKLIRENQYGFIKSRTIQGCLAWAYEYLHFCHKSRKEVVVLRAKGFGEAFDKVDHSFILIVLSAKCFGEQWCLWIQQILDSANSDVLLNGIPGSTFK